MSIRQIRHYGPHRPMTSSIGLVDIMKWYLQGLDLDQLNIRRAWPGEDAYLEDAHIGNRLGQIALIRRYKR